MHPVHVLNGRLDSMHDRSGCVVVLGITTTPSQLYILLQRNSTVRLKDAIADLNKMIVVEEIQKKKRVRTTVVHDQHLNTSPSTHVLPIDQTAQPLNRDGEPMLRNLVKGRKRPPIDPSEQTQRLNRDREPTFPNLVTRRKRSFDESLDQSSYEPMGPAKRKSTFGVVDTAKPNKQKYIYDHWNIPSKDVPPLDAVARLEKLRRPDILNIWHDNPREYEKYLNNRTTPRVYSGFPRPSDDTPTL